MNYENYKNTKRKQFISCTGRKTGHEYAPELEASIKGSIDGVEELTINMESLDYLSSAGLRVLLGAQKIMNKQGSMRVTHVNDTIMEIFEVTGFADILTIEKA